MAEPAAPEQRPEEPRDDCDQGEAAGGRGRGRDQVRQAVPRLRGGVHGKGLGHWQTEAGQTALKFLPGQGAAETGKAA